MTRDVGNQTGSLIVNLKPVFMVHIVNDFISWFIFKDSSSCVLFLLLCFICLVNLPLCLSVPYCFPQFCHHPSFCLAVACFLVFTPFCLKCFLTFSYFLDFHVAEVDSFFLDAL